MAGAAVGTLAVGRTARRLRKRTFAQATRRFALGLGLAAIHECPTHATVLADSGRWTAAQLSAAAARVLACPDAARFSNDAMAETGLMEPATLLRRRPSKLKA
jgi:hypothetical protein